MSSADRSDKVLPVVMKDMLIQLQLDRILDNDEFNMVRNTDNEKDSQMLKVYLQLLKDEGLIEQLSGSNGYWLLTDEGRDFIADAVTLKCEKLLTEKMLR